jgi:hypothetical protein
MGTKRPDGADAVLLRLSGSDITVSRTAVLPYWLHALWAVLSGLRKLIMGCLTQTASGELPATLEQAGSRVQTRTARAAVRMVTWDVLMLIRNGAGAGEGNRTLV